MKKIEFNFKNGITRINGNLESDILDENLFTDIWNSEEIFMIENDRIASFKTDEILFITIDDKKY